MDPVFLATTAMTLIRPLLGKFADSAAEKAGGTAAGAAGSGAAALYRAIRKRMSRDDYHKAILQGAENQPGSDDRIATLSRTLEAIIKDDRTFAVTIADLVGPATQNTAVTGSGAVAAGNMTLNGTYVAGRDLTIGTTGHDTE